MNWLKRFLASTIGQKVFMALSGVALILFVIAHMLGNLQIFIPDGGEALNAYAAALHSNMGILWVARIGLLAAVLVHIGAATALTLRSAAARPTGYKKKVWLGNDYPARTMRWGGVIVLAFVIYHLAHLTLGAVGPEVRACSAVSGEMVCHVRANVIAGFQNLPIAVFYIVAQLALGLHLAHGVWSGLRTLGLNNPRFDGLARRSGIGIALLITLGNISIPVAVQLDSLHILPIFS
jgi:succinate dehydrogenase / fumarate reductase cytochrome b subunit